MSTIDYRVIRNYLRGIILANTSLLETQFAFEGRPFDSDSQDMYVEEVISIENEDKRKGNGNALQVVFTYNVYCRLGVNSNIVEDAENLRWELVDYFNEMPAFTVGSYNVWFQERPTRRNATEKDGRRLAPVDIVLRIFN